MATFDFAVSKELSKALEVLTGDALEEMFENALFSAGRIVLKAYKEELKRAIGSNKNSKSTGELLDSLGMTPMKRNNDGFFDVRIGFNEPRRTQRAAKGKRSYKTSTNAMIATVFEYGRHGQPARPFVVKARKKSINKALEEMGYVFSKEIEKL